jgi:branched-chain amino acid transport system permease protein
MILTLIAMGLNLIFGLMDIVNFAHGNFYALGAYLGLTVISLVNNYWIAILVAPLIVGGLGFVNELAYRRFYAVPDPTYRGIFTLFFSFGLAWVMEEATRWIWGPMGIPFLPPPELAWIFQMGGFTYPIFRLFAIAVCASIGIGVWLFLTKTNIGLIIRGGIQNRSMVQALGINIAPIFGATFALGVAIAAIGGMIGGPILGVYPAMGTEVQIETFVIVVIGGMGSFGGSIISGLLVGVVMALAALIDTRLSIISIFVFMLIMLVARPAGLFGELER